MRALVVLLLFVGVATAQYRFPPVYHTYTDGAKKAQAEGKYLVTFVGCQPHEVEGTVVCTVIHLPEYPGQCVIISKDGYWKKTIDGVPSCETICNAVHHMTSTKREVQATTAPALFSRIAQSSRGGSC